MTYKTLLLQTDARGVATLTLNRPEKHNVLSAEMIDELRDAARSLGADDAVRVVVLTGAGKSFCAGGDLDWMRAQFTASRETRMAEARRLAMMLYDLNTLPKPLIGRINGTAMGGGIGIMSVCDSAVVATGGKFGLTETRLGLIPATISPYVLARMGEGRARRVFMNARIFGAEELTALNLATRVVEMDDLDKTVEAEVTPYLTCAPQAVARAKALARRLGPAIDEALIEDTIAALADTWEGPEAQEGIAAFFEKRPATWVLG
ncbi:crotonase/enoyl-CoA hydratase family protein [Halovulum sp. GXIMD14793]